MSRPTGPRRAHEPDLIGAVQVAAILQVKDSNLDKIPDLPEPYQRIAGRDGTGAGRRVWRRSDIEEFSPGFQARRRKQTHP